MLAAITVAFVVAAIGLLTYQLRRVQLSDAIRTKVDRLVLQPPDGFPELEWAVQVYWMHNLHGAAIPQVYGTIASLQKLERFLDDAITVGPDSETIEALWDRYATMSHSGYRYRKRFEPVRDEIVEAVAREGEDFLDARSYQDFLQYVRSTEPTVN